MKTRKTVLVIALGVGVLLFLGTCVTTKTETPLPEVAGETWDYVILGSPIGTWWAENYGALMGSDLGVKIVYHSYSVHGQSVEQLLQSVIRYDELREDIRTAEVITIGSGFVDMYVDAIMGYTLGAYDRQEMEQNVKAFRETYNSMLDEVLTLASPSDTIIRTMDFYYPYVGYDQEMGIYNQTKRYWQKFNKCIVQAARKRSIPVAKVFQAFHGPDGKDDPAEKGYLDRDGKHPSEEGIKVIAEEFRKLGYEYASP
jgi:lysophospholipase L1-like esterase